MSEANIRLIRIMRAVNKKGDRLTESFCLLTRNQEGQECLSRFEFVQENRQVFTRDPQGYASHIRSLSPCRFIWVAGLVGDWLSQAINPKWFQSACWPVVSFPRPKHSAEPRIGGWLTDWVLFRWIQRTLYTSWCNPCQCQQPFGCRWAKSGHWLRSLHNCGAEIISEKI